MSKLNQTRNCVATALLLSYVGGHALQLFGGKRVAPATVWCDRLFRASCAVWGLLAGYGAWKGTLKCSHSGRNCKKFQLFAAGGVALAASPLLKRASPLLEDAIKIGFPMGVILATSDRRHKTFACEQITCFSIMLGSSLIGAPTAESIAATTMLPLALAWDLSVYRAAKRDKTA